MAYIADPRTPRKAAPMVFPSVASTMLNEEAGHETAGGGRETRKKRESNRTIGKPGYHYNFVHTWRKVRYNLGIRGIIDCYGCPYWDYWTPSGYLRRANSNIGGVAWNLLECLWMLIRIKEDIFWNWSWYISGNLVKAGGSPSQNWVWWGFLPSEILIPVAMQHMASSGRGLELAPSYIISHSLPRRSKIIQGLWASSAKKWVTGQPLFYVQKLHYRFDLGEFPIWCLSRR